MSAADKRPDMGRYGFTVFLCLLVCGYYYYFFFNRAYVQLDIEVTQSTVFKLYWSAENKPFSEKKRSVVSLAEGRNRLEFFLADLGNIKNLRIDPLQFEGEAYIRHLSLSQRGYKQITVDFDKLEPLNDIAEYSLDKDGLRLFSSGVDPNFLYVPNIESAFNWIKEITLFSLICFFVVIVTRAVSPLKQNFSYIPIMLAMVLVLVLTMAAVSQRNAHPDEYVHLDATSYYQENWLPPIIEDETIEHTYSAYGVSRLNNGEIYYLFSGKVSQFAQILKLDTLFSLRLFNVLLFTLIVLYSIYSVSARLVALPFLFSPQIWYIFSYCGSDAFGLFICFIAGCEIMRPNSYLNRIIGDRRRRGVVTATFLVAVMLALLFLLKKNFYPFVVFFYLVILWQIFKEEDRESRTIFFKRLIVATLLAFSVAGLRIGADYYVNGFDRQEKIHTMQEKMAHFWYKPSTDLHQKHVSLHMKDRGTSLNELIVGYKWFQMSFVTGFGHYGYFTIAAPGPYYVLIKWAAGALLLYTFLMIFIRGGLENSVFAILAVGLSVALLFASLYLSWTKGFQAQGRYLFPVVPMLGIVLAKARELCNSRFFILGVTQLYLLGIYSFIFVALLSIPRAV